MEVGVQLNSFSMLALDGGECELHDPAALPLDKETPLSFESEAGWAPEVVWMFCSREQSFVPAGSEPLIVQPIA